MVDNISSKTYYEKEIESIEFGLCSNCKEPQTDDDWCQICNSKRFQQNFKEWTSGNDHIDKFIQEAQLKARNHHEVLEWIPYNKLKDVQYLTHGGFSTIYKAIWLDGNIKKWNNGWERYSCNLEEEDYENAGNENEENGFLVVLKSLNNSSNIHKDFLNEWKNNLQFLYSAINNYTKFVKIFGITRDPKTSNYMIILQEMKQGSLRSNLLVKKYNPDDKYQNLYEIASSLSALHKCDLVHGDLHSGNLLLKDAFCAYISDFGLSRPAHQSINSDEVYGVIPYVAPEVLRGNPYTKAADIYSFGIIMWEFTSGIPAFNNVPHDVTLSLKICEGYRPKIIEGTDPGYAKLMRRCWSNDINQRPTAEELTEVFDVLSTKHIIELNHEKRIPVPENEPIIENHPLSCYVSRKLDYSATLNELLFEDEYSVCEDDETIYSESLNNCLLTEKDIEFANNLGRR